MKSEGEINQPGFKRIWNLLLGMKYKNKPISIRMLNRDSAVLWLSCRCLHRGESRKERATSLGEAVSVWVHFPALQFQLVVRHFAEYGKQ